LLHGIRHRSEFPPLGRAMLLLSVKLPSAAPRFPAKISTASGALSGAAVFDSRIWAK
jgi:hypothetical protein